MKSWGAALLLLAAVPTWASPFPGGEEWNRLTGGVLDSVWKISKGFLQKVPGRGGPSWMTGTVEKLLDLTYQQLRDQNRIVYFNAEIRKQFGIDDHSCLVDSRWDSCRKIYAFYVPEWDLIFVDPGLWDLPEVFPQALLHEVFHAYQLRFRFPLDASLLWEMPQIPRNWLHDYLNYLYEGQANWYVLSLGKNEAWNREIDSLRKWYHLGAKFYEFGGNFVIYVASLAMAAINLPFQLAGDDLFAYKPVLPLGDQVDGFLGGEHIPVFGGEESDRLFRSSMLSNRELIVEDKFYHPFAFNFYPFVPRLHQHIAKRVEEVYFKKLDLLFKWTRDDQRNFVELHNRYYLKLALQNQLTGCESFFDKMSQDVSPFHFWSNIAQQELDTCFVYAGVSAESIRSFASQGLVSTNSPFRGRALSDGTEGSGPDLQLLPIVEFLPQLEVSPN